MPKSENAVQSLPNSSPLLREYRWYRANQEELVNRYLGRYLVIVNETIIGDYSSVGVAYRTTSKVQEPGTFLIQFCKPKSEERPVIIRNHVITTFE